MQNHNPNTFQTLPHLQNRYFPLHSGKNMAQATLARSAKDGMIDIDARLQLNTDRLALDTQRVTKMACRAHSPYLRLVAIIK